MFDPAPWWKWRRVQRRNKPRVRVYNRTTRAAERAMLQKVLVGYLDPEVALWPMKSRKSYWDW